MILWILRGRFWIRNRKISKRLISKNGSLPNYSSGVLKSQPNLVVSAMYNRQCEGHKVTAEIVVCLISTGVTAFHKRHYHTFSTHHLEVTDVPLHRFYNPLYCVHSGAVHLTVLNWVITDVRILIRFLRCSSAVTTSCCVYPFANETKRRSSLNFNVSLDVNSEWRNIL